jgi:hypothetical protein
MKIRKSLLFLLICSALLSCSISDDKKDLTTKNILDSNLDTGISDINSGFHTPNDTTYSISDILNPENGNSSALYYAINKQDTSYVTAYLEIMDSVEFNKFFQLAFNLKSYLFEFDLKLWSRRNEEITLFEQKMIKTNTMSIFNLYLSSCILFNFEKSIPVGKILTDKFDFYHRKYTSKEIDEIDRIMNEKCNE